MSKGSKLLLGLLSILPLILAAVIIIEVFLIFPEILYWNHNEPEAYTIMLSVHEKGIGVAGVYTYEIATMKSEKAKNLAKAREYPLLCTVEEE